MSDKVWRSMQFPKELAEYISSVAKKERRSFSSQALIFIEGEIVRYQQEQNNLEEAKING